jgi:uncharacterized repeat protein (TIGR01451 family)
MLLFFTIFNLTHFENTCVAINNTYQDTNVEIEITVKRLNDETWMNEAEIYNNSKIKIRILIQNTGDNDLLNLELTNTIPTNLEYVNTITDIEPYEISNNTLYWYFSSIGSCCGEQIIEILYYANVTSTGDEINTVYIEADSNEGLIQNEDIVILHAIEDTIKPFVTITKPEKGIYISNTKIFSFFLFVIVFGDIDIEVEANDIETGIGKIEFYLNEDIESIDTTPPYNWILDKGLFGKYVIHVRAYDKVGNYAENKLTLWKIM